MIYEKAFEIITIILIGSASLSCIGCSLKNIGKFICYIRVLK